ncbi:MAG: hypothetical protein IKS99_04485 [Firmicutes bacterium]|nr:hypothetical protein [Bacillota bacterium]
MDNQDPKLKVIENEPEPETENETQDSKKSAEYYFKQVAKVTGWSYDQAREEMKTVKKQLGIPYGYYYRNNYFEYSRSKQERKANRYHRKQKEKKEMLARIISETGLKKNDIKTFIKTLNEYEIYKVNLEKISIYGMYKMGIDKIIPLLESLKLEKELSEPLKKDLLSVDSGVLSYVDLSEKLEKYMECIRATITPFFSERLKDRLEYNIPGFLEQNADRIDKIIEDIVMSQMLLGFRFSEYVMLHLYEYDLAGKREFLSDSDKDRIVNSINTQEFYDCVGNKYSLYLVLKDAFARDFTPIMDEEDFPAFMEFIDRHSEFVLKPFNDSMGRGVKLISVTPGSNLEELFASLLEENLTFLMEERIIQDERMAVFNRDSINTIRLMVYYNGEQAIPANSFMRTGRAGSFVDNGGAGGLFANVDLATGVINTVGGNETGALFEEHPDSHIRYIGFQIPQWDEALKLGCESCKVFGEPCFIGWDLALNDKGKWVIVEGNGSPQFLNQVPLCHGLKQYMKDFIENNGISLNE